MKTLSIRWPADPFDVVLSDLGMGAGLNGWGSGHRGLPPQAGRTTVLFCVLVRGAAIDPDRMHTKKASMPSSPKPTAPNNSSQPSVWRQGPKPGIGELRWIVGERKCSLSGLQLPFSARISALQAFMVNGLR